MPVCIIAGAGDYYDDPIIRREGDYVIAADGGYTRLSALNVAVDEVIGDFDSIESLPVHPNVTRLPVEKDDTDMLYALRIGMKRGYRVFHLYGGTGGRLDHTLANLQCLSFLARRGLRGYLHGDGCVITALHNEMLSLAAQDTGTISVFAAGGQAEGVTLTGLHYPLDNAVLTCDFPLGVSNEFIGQPASVAVTNGTLIVVLPGNAVVL